MSKTQTTRSLIKTVKRKYIEADWDGSIKGKIPYITNWTNIKFGVELDEKMFEKPAK